ncbi:hypothetical protein BU24DRAFT_68872 [Aaosphaeria arxii CBS 175.79]|uniref:Folliculin-interacting protein N-terminal domain-containing protein n=1 Tax=Aaosphaeria arxii CBS 175.79 TaxID=1450172 RepID=A0A6A5XAQ0_9PLEO|nr:uncharacterized protein BU24DRAFT_68872 [Aaosphaeria arxii CBS 175.79]KAF2009989.1 hypothetical protein BU24DRAFT_68872 [Aaosphaeria arxii CBS 175.79]
MLGQFFGGRKATGATHPSPTTPLESATEESHTRHLLYPELNSNYPHDGQHYPLPTPTLPLGNGYDGPQPEIDLEFPRDCRIIIAQDEINAMPRTVLYDSKPGSPRAESPTQQNARSRPFGSTAGANTAGPSFGGVHARRSSLVTEPTPRSPTVAAFSRTRARGGSISSMPNIDEHTQTHAQFQAKPTESFDVVKTCLDCMFGNTTMSYRGNSNKLHIVPLDSRPADLTPAAASLHEASGSLGRSEGLRRRSNLAKSFTPSNFPIDMPQTDTPGNSSKESRRRTILITRMFSVALPDEERDSSDPRTPTPQSSLGKGNGFPFPRTGNKAGVGATRPPQPSQSRRTPMYAITIILHLPLSSSSPTMRPPSRPGHSAARGTAHLSTSAPGQDSLGSSLDSDRRAGWTTIDPNFGVESLLSMSLSSDVDDRVDVIGQHWDVITRTLTSLQYVVRERILAHFRMNDARSPTVSPLPRGQPSRYATREPLPQVGRRFWRLQPNELAIDPLIRQAVEVAGNRVVSGMRIPRVVTGQGKWGVWREEARWLGRWANRREENFFFFNLLTAFLGHHTEWLNILGPKWHRKRHREQQKSLSGDNLTIPNRTVIVSPDKMAARRLIFLLAAFLPSGTSVLYDGASPMRPGTSASFRAYSQSPPTNLPPSRKHSLRRQINRRPRGKPSLTNMRPQHGGSSSNGSTFESSNIRVDSGVAEFQDASKQHSCRSSVNSIQNSLVLPPMSDSAASKSGSATTSTATPENNIPVAHFALPRTKSSGPPAENRPESSDSLASANLMNTLQRSNTGHISNRSTDSGNTSRWSGFMSFWNGGRRESSTDHSDFLQSTDDGLGVPHFGFAGERRRSQLEQMVHELSMDQETFDESDAFDSSNLDNSTTADGSPETYPMGGSSGMPASAARPIPERPKTFDSTLKLSINEKDGVIDVDIPLPDFGSPLQSPLLGGYGSASSQQGSSFGETSILSMPYCEPDQPVNAAGWLKQFHPDFAIQAIKPYADLERDIKQAMSAEPTPVTSAATPTLEQGPQERWVDVCSALVSDTRNFTIKRIRLRRLVKITPLPTYHQAALTPSVTGVPGRSQYGNPYSASTVGPTMTEQHLTEEFSEETIMDFDATLIDAVDRVLAQSGQGSRVQSTSSSRSSSRRGRRDTRTSFDAGHGPAEISQGDYKGIIFDALESVVRDVTSERTGKEQSTKDKALVTDKKVQQDAPASTATDSSLKEGIRRWLTEVE